MLWTDECEIVLFGEKGFRLFVRRLPNSEYKPQFTAKMIKLGGCINYGMGHECIGIYKNPR